MKWPFGIAAILLWPHQAAIAKPFMTEIKTPDAEFSYSWSAEVSGIPALVKRFRADMRAQRSATIAGGREFNAERMKSGSAEAIGFMHSTEISTAGQSPRLLSLRIDVGEYTGGAHGNSGTDSLIWDRRLGRELKFEQLFASRARFAMPIRAAYCRALDAERKKRRGGDGRLGGMIAEFDSCPPLSDLAVFPADEDRNGRFERLRLVASPYVAGPYVEGEYDIEVPVTVGLIAMITTEYRSSFEAQPQ